MGLGLARNNFFPDRLPMHHHFLFGRGPKRVIETACFDAKASRHAIRANVNKQVNKRSDANVCLANVI